MHGDPHVSGTSILIDGLGLNGIEQQSWASTYGAFYSVLVAEQFALGRGAPDDDACIGFAEEAASVADDSVSFLRRYKAPRPRKLGKR